MFTSKQYLRDHLGVDESIAAFFVDRKVPANNHYWKGKFLYVASGTGYLFLPLFFDLQFKCGISRELLLNEQYITLMEAILNSAAMHEFEEISFQQHLANCRKIADGNIKNAGLYNDLLLYLSDDQLKPFKNLGTTRKALNRGDSFLFCVCFLDIDKHTTDRVLENWYALVPSFLLMDDISDLRDDKEKNEENALTDFGQGKAGVEKAIEFLRDKFGYLKILNSKLGSYFEKSLERKLQTPYMQWLMTNC